MNEETAQQMLAELKSLRRINQICSVVALVALVGACIYLPISLRSIRAAHKAQQTQSDSWAAVSSAIDRLDYDSASAITHRIIEKHPNYYYGYSYLGEIALAQNRLKEAEENYVRAYELFPSEAHEKKLEAIRKRIANDPNPVSK